MENVSTIEEAPDFFSDEYGEVTDIIWDGDNTIWDWVKYAVHAYEAMSQAIADAIGKPEPEVAAAMKRFYTIAGTMEDERLIQGMQAAGFFNDLQDFNKDKMVLKAQKAFSAARTKYLHNYKGAKDTFRKTHAAGIRNRILTDATAFQAKQRVMAAKIGDYVYHVNAMPAAVIEDLHEEFVAKRKAGKYDVPFKVTEVKIEKPFSNLEEILEMTVEEIRRHVVMVGDNFNKDMGIPRRYGCRGMHATYGTADADYIRRLQRFAPERIAQKNVQIGTAPKAVTDKNIISIDSIEDVPRILGIKRARR